MKLDLKALSSVVCASIAALVVCWYSESAAQALTLRPVPTGKSALILRKCPLIEGVRRVSITRRGRRITLPVRAERKPYRLPQRFRFFGCETNEAGVTTLSAAQALDGPVLELTFTANDFPKISSTSYPDAACKEFPGSIFKPCICPEQVPTQIQYRPALDVCNGRAAAILSGNLSSSFSVVLRDSQNRDRVPARGYNGCTDAEVEAGLNKCSAFKCQQIIRSSGQTICCFGEPGSSSIMAGATRMTIKLKDSPSSTNDPLLRICLPGYDPINDLN